MTKVEAAQIIDNVLSRMQLTRQEHATLIQALAVLKDEPAP